MAELPLDEAIPRFKANEDRMDRFANGSDTTTWLTSGAVVVPSLRKFLKDKNDEIDSASTTIYQARDQAVTAKTDAQAALADFKQRYLGQFTALPTNASIGFTIPNGAIVSLANSSDPSLDGLYLRKNGAWEMASGILPAEYSFFATAGQTTLTVPGGYDIKTVKVYRNGIRQKIGASPGSGDTANDCTASNGTTIVYPASTLLLNDWIFVVWGRSFNVASISAVNIAYVATGALTATTMQQAIDQLEANKVPSTRQIIAAGLATGTGNLGTNVTITVPKASDATVIAGVDDTQAVTSKGVRAAIVAIGATPGWSRVAEGETVAGQTVLDLALPDTFKSFELWLDKFKPATAGQHLIMRIATDGVPNFLNPASYVYNGSRRSNSVENDWRSVNQTYFQLSQSPGNGATHMGAYKLDIMNSGADYGQIFARSSYRRSDTGLYQEQILQEGSFWGSAVRWTHIRLVFFTGNIEAGGIYRLNGQS